VHVTATLVQTNSFSFIWYIPCSKETMPIQHHV